MFPEVAKGNKLEFRVFNICKGEPIQMQVG